LICLGLNPRIFKANRGFSKARDGATGHYIELPERVVDDDLRNRYFLRARILDDQIDLATSEQGLFHLERLDRRRGSHPQACPIGGEEDGDDTGQEQCR
jgi:hypothetical protein